MRPIGKSFVAKMDKTQRRRWDFRSYCDILQRKCFKETQNKTQGLIGLFNVLVEYVAALLIEGSCNHVAKEQHHRAQQINPMRLVGVHLNGTIWANSLHCIACLYHDSAHCSSETLLYGLNNGSWGLACEANPKQLAQYPSTVTHKLTECQKNKLIPNKKPATRRLIALEVFTHVNNPSLCYLHVLHWSLLTLGMPSLWLKRGPRLVCNWWFGIPFYRFNTGILVCRVNPVADRLLSSGCGLSTTGIYLFASAPVCFSPPVTLSFELILPGTDFFSPLDSFFLKSSSSSYASPSPFPPPPLWHIF